MVSKDLSPAGVADLLEKGVAACFESARESLRTAKFMSYSFQKGLESAVYPTVGSLIDLNQQVTESVLSALTLKKPAGDAVLELTDRASSAMRFSHLVHTLGKELFGSARFAGEVTLAEEGPYRLVHIPPDPAAGKVEMSVFHAAGAIPYSDRIFRILPEANLFLPFHKRGIPLYVMELAGDKKEVDYASVTVDRLIDILDRFTDLAFKHNGGKKMVLEGYCGHGMQAMAFVAARPEEAEARFSTAALFVAPVDGRECGTIAEMVQNTPEYLTVTTLGFWRLLAGYLPGESVQVGLDLSLRTLNNKTMLGYALTGWNRSEYAGVKSVEDLKPVQRRELAGAYWLTAENSGRYPIPVELVRYASDLFSKGVGTSGQIPYRHNGKPLSFQEIRDRTTLKIIGFYGGKDLVVPDRTAHVLLGIFGDRYRHVVHPLAGHISYVLSPEIWAKSSSPASLSPNPIDVMLEAAAR